MFDIRFFFSKNLLSNVQSRRNTWSRFAEYFINFIIFLITDSIYRVKVSIVMPCKIKPNSINFKSKSNIEKFRREVKIQLKKWHRPAQLMIIRN